MRAFRHLIMAAGLAALAKLQRSGRDGRCLSAAIVRALTLLISTAAIGQSLAVHRGGADRTWLEATSSLDIGYRFQAVFIFSSGKYQ